MLDNVTQVLLELCGIFTKYLLYVREHSVIPCWNDVRRDILGRIKDI